jgi:hypothetical protein
MVDILQQIIYGDLSWLYFIVFLGLGFAVSAKVRVFNLIMMVACIFQGINYLTYYNTQPLSINWVWQPVLMFLASAIFLWQLAEIKLW